MPKLAALLCLSLLVGACSSGPSRRAEAPADADLGTPLRVTYIMYRSGQRLELVNEAHTGRVEQYSQVRSDASRKVQTNDVMEGLVEVLRDNGFDRFSNAGPAPLASGSAGPMPWALELDDSGAVSYIGAVPGLSPKDNQTLLRLATAFVDTYNATYGLQAVKLKPGQSPFSNPAATRSVMTASRDKVRAWMRTPFCLCDTSALLNNSCC